MSTRTDARGGPGDEAGSEAWRRAGDGAGTGPARPAATAGPAGPNPATMARLRVRFSKVGKVRWTSHRDVARMWERALRRSGLPVAYSGGFSPHPLLSFGLALPTGCESTAEYVDVVLDPARSGDDPGAWWAATAAAAGPDWAERVADALPGRLTPLLPDGVDVMAARVVPAGQASLQQAVTSCTWRIDVPGDPAPVVAAVDAALAAPTLPVVRERKGRREADDLRPSLLAMRVETRSATGPAAGATLTVDTATRPRGVRPTEIAGVLGVALGTACRTHQWIERDGSAEEPVVARQALVTELLGRAS